MSSASGTPAAGGSTAPAAPPVVQNIDIRVPKNQNKKLAIMRFNGSMGIDFVKWTHVKMERENNQVQFKGFNEDMPKFGAGSEYGREAREEARRKKYGIISRKYKPEDQPWILQHGGKGASKKLRGVRDGGVAENASYYVFTQAPDGAFEAFPVQEQYSFQQVQNYKALSYEEAEEEFSSRSRTFNLFNVMVRKRMKKNDEDADEDGEEEGEGKGKGKGKKKKNAKDSRFGDELEDMMESSNGESSDDDDDDDDGDKKKKKKGKKPAKPKKKRKNGSDDEPLEDSDDGDGEGRELDYISSSDEDSDVDLDAKDGLKGVAEEDALRKLLNSDEEDEDEEKEEDEDKDKEDEDAEGGEDQPGDKSKDDKDDKKKKKDKKKSKDKKPRKEEYGSSSDSGGESSGSELEKAKPSPKMKSNSANSSRSATPTKPGTSQPEALSDSKRKGISEAIMAQATKKPRLDISSASSAASSAASAASSNTNEGVNEESVRRYLSRKPMTTTELLQKFKSKRTGLSSEQLVPHIAQILKKINPVKQTIKGKMYLSIKG